MPLETNPVIAVVGSLNIDLIAYTDRVPDAGETLIGTDFRMGFGGKGANQAVMAARLGGRVSMVGALGDDVFAGMTFDNLDRHFESLEWNIIRDGRVGQHERTQCQ